MSVYKSLLLTPGQRQQGAWRGLLNVGQALSAAGAPSTMPTSTIGAFSKGLAAYAPGYDQYANDMRGQKLQDTQYQMQQQQMQQQQMAIDAAKRKKAQEEQQRLAAERYATQQRMGGAQGPTIAAGQAQNRMDPLTLATMQADPVGYMQSAYIAQTARTAADLAHQRALQLKDPNEFTMWMSQNPGKTVSDYMVEKRSRIPVPGTDTPYSPEVLAQRRELAEAEAGAKPLTEAQAKSGTFGLRMAGASAALQQTMAGPDGKIGTADDYVPSRQDVLSYNFPGVGNSMVSPEYRAYRQGQDDWISANLRKESGAVIGVEEMVEERKKYFPQPGDEERTIKQKAASRRAAEAAMKVSAGRAYEDMMKELGGNPFDGFTVIRNN
jgi:hypothetical protein